MPMGYRHGGFFDGFSGPGPSLFGIMMMIVFWAAIALVIMIVVRNWRHGPHVHDHAYGPGPGATPDPRTSSYAASPAIDVLKERFARGEVSEEEFTRRLTLLKES
ncbi:MAG: hypothetical protein HIU57_03765 [Acidobacteria bacterium]|nr:hypothetical protein [Acidobacteriota bacterium]